MYHELIAIFFSFWKAVWAAWAASGLLKVKNFLSFRLFQAARAATRPTQPEKQLFEFQKSRPRLFLKQPRLRRLF